MNCIIVDDDSTARLVVRKLCTKFDSLNVIGEFESAIEAIKFANKNEVDLVFLDIHMPTFSGFDFIETLKSQPKIVLTTADKSFALQAFEYKNVVDYLLKPITLKRFDLTISKIMESDSESMQSVTPNKNSKFLYVSVDRRLVKINIPDINVIEAKGDYILIKTPDQNYIVHSTLKKIGDKLPDDLFLKVHRSFIINLSKIVDIQDNSIVIEKMVIPISRSNKALLFDKLNML